MIPGPIESPYKESWSWLMSYLFRLKSLLSSGQVTCHIADETHQSVEVAGVLHKDASCANVTERQLLPAA